MEEFTTQVEGMPVDIALLGVIMDKHGLIYSEIPEIGGKSMVSQVMSGKKTMSHRSIEQLGERFGIPPSLFLQ
jgi:HTH-type transcriptional regulator/antitoxin HigA